MNPFFFGNQDNPLFGVYHPPKSQQILNMGILLCYPQARECEITRWAMRRLADMIAKAGAHVLRFDYSGTGDSSGDYESANLVQWKSDIRIAMEELKDRAWVKKISLVGLRLGASLATLVAEETEIENLILWDPVINGREYIKELKKVHRIMSFLSMSTMNLKEFSGNRSEELLGFPFSPELEASIAEIDLINSIKFKAKRTSLVVSREDSKYFKLRDHLFQAGISFDYCFAPDNGDWGNAEGNLNIFFAKNILQKITEIVAGIDS
jgi:exosortase A-associated hydrolase 2